MGATFGSLSRLKERAGRLEVATPPKSGKGVLDDIRRPYHVHGSPMERNLGSRQRGPSKLTPRSP